MNSIYFTPYAQVVAQLISIFAFLAYGIACFVSKELVLEFQRYRLPYLRRLTGFLEIAGSLGLALGFIYDPLRILSAGCLSLLMVFGILARMRIKDPLFAMLPAIALLLLNLFISTAR
jgi:hypothetical protein